MNGHDILASLREELTQAPLLHHSPDRFWRRVGIIAFEDVGVADLDTVGLVAALPGKSFRARLGGEWAVASYLTQRLAHATKCRAADDLTMAAERHPAFERARLALTYENFPLLMQIACGSAVLPVRALAIWFAIGTVRVPS